VPNFALDMNSSSSRNSLLAAVALAGLLVYVLACASFSPDDSKVAVPAFDARTGEFGITVFHRKTARLTPVFSFSVLKSLAEPSYEAQLLRAQWLDNQRLIVAWPGGEGSSKGDSKTINLLLLLEEGKGAVRCWQIPEVEELAGKMARPLAVAGSRLFMSVDSNLVARLDLETGQVVSHLCRGEAIELYPSGHKDFVFYTASLPGESNKVEVGKLDAATFAQTTLQHVESVRTHGRTLSDVLGTPLAFSADGRQVAMVSDNDDPCLLRIARSGQAEQSILLSAGDERLQLGGLCFSPRGDLVFASFARETKTETNVTFGVLTVPLDGRPARRTLLFTGPEKADRDSVVYLQPGLSHDGKTLALASTYLFGDPDQHMRNPSDCALYLVDVSKTPHRVRKVTLPLPRPDHPFK